MLWRKNTILPCFLLFTVNNIGTYSVAVTPPPPTSENGEIVKMICISVLAQPFSLFHQLWKCRRDCGDNRTSEVLIK